MLGKLIIILWIVVSFILLVGDHHMDGVRPYNWDSDPPDDGVQLPSCWWVTKFWMVDDPPGDGVRASWGW